MISRTPHTLPARLAIAVALLLSLVIAAPAATPTSAERAAWLDLARRGWNYRPPAPRRDADRRADVTISARTLAGSALCLVGERPQPETLEVLDAFRALMGHAFGKTLPMRYAGAESGGCGTGRVVTLRLFSGYPPNRALSDDLQRLNALYDLGLPRGRAYVAMAPALAQTFFGGRGQTTHIMVQQASGRRLSALERTFFRSILIEELFQAFTFGADILTFDPKAEFLSKLQESPMNLGRLPWGSPEFMSALLRTTPAALCRFDVFMLHAVALTPSVETTGADFLDYVEAHFAELAALTDVTVADARFGALIDPACRRGPMGG